MIFESPDGGKTIFTRLERHDDTISPERLELNHLWVQWRDILTASKYNPTLKEALDRAQLIYELSRRDSD
jgi:hypothetical protein